MPIVIQKSRIGEVDTGGVMDAKTQRRRLTTRYHNGELDLEEYEEQMDRIDTPIVFEVTETHPGRERFSARVRTGGGRSAHNRRYSTTGQTQIRRVRVLIAENRLDEAEEAARLAYLTLDRATRRRLIHPSNAARRKGRLRAELRAARADDSK